MERFLPYPPDKNADARRGFGSVALARFRPVRSGRGMAFRLTVSEMPDLMTMRLAGRLGDDAAVALNDACDGARRPLVLDLSQVTDASDAAVLLLRRLTGEGIHLLGASQYVTLLLTAEEPPAVVRPQPRGCRPQDLSRKAGQRQKAGPS